MCFSKFFFHIHSYVHHGTVVSTTAADWDRSFNINVKSMFFMSKYVIEYVSCGLKSVKL